jgi:putative tricarboxylic transport membrane protein
LRVLPVTPRLGGALFALLGLVLFVLALDQPARLASGRIGPGFVAQGAAALLVGLAMLAILGPAGVQPPGLRGTARQALALLAAIAAFALLLRPLGFLLAAFAAAVLAAAAAPRARPAAALLTGALTAGGAALLFVGLLGMPLPLGPR